MNEDERRIVEFLRAHAARIYADAISYEKRTGERWEFKHHEALCFERAAMLITGGEHRRERP